MPSAAAPEIAGGAADPLVWDKERTCVLIDLWCERPALYDFTCDEYKDRNRRKAAVSEIAAELRTEEREVVKKMKNLRRQYSRERSLTEAAKAASAITGEEPSFSSNWYYYRKMSFLDLFMNAKPAGAAARATEPHQESMASDSSDSRHDDANQLSSPGAGDWVADHSSVAAVESNGDLQEKAGAGSGTSGCNRFSMQHSLPEGVVSCPAGEGSACQLARDGRDIDFEEPDPCGMEQSYVQGSHQIRVFHERNGDVVGTPDTAESCSTTGQLMHRESPSMGQMTGSMPTETDIRRMPISSIHVMKRMKRKRQRVVSPVLPPPDSRHLAAVAESRLPSAAAPELLPSSPAARPRTGSGSWDSDDIFGKFIADELRQITDIRAKRLTKFKMHAALLEAHHELPRTPPSQWDPA